MLRTILEVISYSERYSDKYITHIALVTESSNCEKSVKSVIEVFRRFYLLLPFLLPRLRFLNALLTSFPILYPRVGAVKAYGRYSLAFLNTSSSLKPNLFAILRTVFTPISTLGSNFAENAVLAILSTTLSIIGSLNIGPERSFLSPICFLMSIYYRILFGCQIIIYKIILNPIKIYSYKL